MSGNAYIKYLTEQVTTYIDLPPEVKKQRRIKRKQSLSNGNHWFGVLPFALRLLFIKEK